MMTKPFLSIIIPTKNRSALVCRTIDSILNQDYEDYEVILVDNDDSDNTMRAVSKYSDEHFKYYRTGNLSMADNWNFGYRQTRGEYICLIPDKEVFKPGALRILADLLSQYNPDSLSWTWSEILSDSDCGKLTGSGKVVSHSTLDLINMFLGMKHSDYSYLRIHLPRGLNSCIKRDLYNKIIRKTGKISLENTPDYTQAYQILFNSEFTYTIDLSLVGRFNRDIKYGTGAQHDLGYINQAVNNMNSKNTDISSINYQPLKITNTETIVMEDFFRVSEMYGRSYSFKNVNHRNYFKTIYRNTLGRQSYVYPDNIEYFRELKLKIKFCMQKTYAKGLRKDLVVCKLFDLFYYPFHRCGVMTFKFIHRYVPSLAAFMWIIGEKI